MQWFQREARQQRGSLPDVLKLSHSSMSVAEECRLCGWLHARGIRRPSFPVASITHGIDHEAKRLCDLHRTTGTLPLALRAGLDGSFAPDLAFQLSWTHPRHHCVIRGRLDDLFVERNRTLSPLDHKSCNRAPEVARPSHGKQLDLYALLVMKWPAYAGYGISGRGIVVYHYPALQRGTTAGSTRDEHRLVISSEIRTVEVDPERALDRIDRVVDLLKGPKPLPSPDCPYCEWGEM